jgi:hypothetical protein
VGSEVITFKRFLLEAEKKDLVQYLKEYCLPAVHDFIKADKFLWRGMHPKHEYETFKAQDEEIEIASVQPRSDRNPKDTPEWAHKIIDDFFEEKFNQRLRSSSTFVFNAKTPAGAYGLPHMVIPVGKYSLYWSSTVGDLTTDLFPDLSSGADSWLAGGMEFWENEGFQAEDVSRYMEEHFIRDRLQEFDYKRGPNEEALKDGHGEIMLVCARYLAIPEDTVGQGFIMSCMDEAAK